MFGGVCIDITPGMISKLKERAQQLNLPVQAKVMNGQELQFADASFDAILLHLILAVIPDPVACIKEVERVLKPGGTVMVFDKFLPDGQKPSALRRLLNQFASTLFSDVNRSMQHRKHHQTYVAATGTERACSLGWYFQNSEASKAGVGFTLSACTGFTEVLLPFLPIYPASKNLQRITISLPAVHSLSC